MNIDDKLLEKLENLSSLKIDESKKKEVEGQIGEILDFVQNLNSLNLNANDATPSLKTPLREDSIKASDVAESILKHAPDSSDNFFIVPKIVE